MAEITKKDIKEAVVEALEPFANAIQVDFKTVNKRLDGVEHRLGGVEHRLGGVEQRLDVLEKDVKWIKDSASQLFEKLDDFITLMKKHDQELAMLAAQVKRLEERVEKIEIRQK